MFRDNTSKVNQQLFQLSDQKQCHFHVNCEWDRSNDGKKLVYKVNKPCYLHQTNPETVYIINHQQQSKGDMRRGYTV